MNTTGTADNWNYMEGKRLVVSYVVNDSMIAFSFNIFEMHSWTMYCAYVYVQQ
jgi:hypothetical protein